MATLSQASHQWATRPADERFTSLTELHDHFKHQRDTSKVVTLANRDLRLVPSDQTASATLHVVGPNGGAYEPNHWAFGQLSNLAGAPSSYLRNLPAPMAADCINYGLHHLREVEEMSVLLRKNGGASTFASANGPGFGRVWNSEITKVLVDRFGNGVDGDWRVPGEFGKKIKVSKENTTLYGSDRDMFVFLADEDNRVKVPNRRDGKAGSLARGFFCWNSEVGHLKLGVAYFLFDYACSNRTVWGAEGFTEIGIRHSSGAPHRWAEEVMPALEAYSRASAKPVEDMIKAAQAKKVGDLNKFLASRFAKRSGDILAAYKADEGERLPETLWDVSVAVTAYARGIQYQDERVRYERMAGEVLKLAA